MRNTAGERTIARPIAHPLPLAAGQLLRLAPEQVRQAENRGGSADPPVPFGLLYLLVL